MNKKKLIISIFVSFIITIICFLIFSPKKYAIININRGFFYQQDMAFNGIYKITNSAILNQFKDNDIKILIKDNYIQLIVNNTDVHDENLIKIIANEYISIYKKTVKKFEEKLVKNSNKKSEFNIELYLSEPYKIDPEIQSIKYFSNIITRYIIFMIIYILLFFTIYNLEYLIKKSLNEIKNIF